MNELKYEEYKENIKKEYNDDVFMLEFMLECLEMCKDDDEEEDEYWDMDIIV
jgi:hypothetical protein